jgi:hypothetical protein
MRENMGYGGWLPSFNIPSTKIFIFRLIALKKFKKERSQ